MRSRFRPRLTYANVVSTTCLFIVLGGGAYAATQLPQNSVGTKQLKQYAVTPPKLSRKTAALIMRSAGRAKAFNIKAVGPGAHGAFGTFAGIKASWACGDAVRLTLSPVGGPTLRFFGWLENSGAVRCWHREAPTPEYAVLPAAAGSPVSMDVVASLPPNGKATHFMLGGRVDPDTGACRFYGQIVPSI